MATETQLSVLTLNIWALPGTLSSNKSERIEAISQTLSKLKYDVVCLQEVWNKSDYKVIKGFVSKSFPYHHFFHSGLLGSGLCIFSKWPIEECFYYRFPLNGYFHMIHHGDWCGGKGVGIAQINVQGLIVNVYNTHLHAQYSLSDVADSYFPHRVIQAFDTALFMRLTSQSAVVSILAGDLNAEPNSLCTKIISCITNVKDVYDVALEKELKPETNDSSRNSYRDKNLAPSFPGRRIDYILIKSNDKVNLKVLSCTFPLDDRIPNKSFSYSDHEAVGTSLVVQTLAPGETKSSDENGTCQKECLENAMNVCDNELMRIKTKIRLHMCGIGFISVIFPFLLISFDFKGIICTAVSLSLCFGLLMVAAEYQNHSWIKNARKRMKLMSNQFKKNE